MNDREVYEEIAPATMRYATALVGPDHAPDIVSTIVIRALQRPGGLSGLDNSKTYLMKAVLNEATGLKRQRARRQTYPMANVPDTGMIPEIEVGNLDAVVMGLPPQQRAAAYLMFFLEYSTRGGRRPHGREGRNGPPPSPPGAKEAGGNHR